MGISRSSGLASGQADAALSGRLIQALEAELANDPARFARALLVFQHARELASTVGVDPQRVLPAALLLEIEESSAAVPPPQATPPHGGLSPSGAAHGAPEGQSKVETILGSVGLDQEALRGVRSLLAAYRDRPKPDTIELAILHDARRLAGLAEERGPGNLARVSIATDDFATEAGKARAQSLFQRAPGRRD